MHFNTQNFWKFTVPPKGKAQGTAATNDISPEQAPLCKGSCREATEGLFANAAVSAATPPGSLCSPTSPYTGEALVRCKVGH